MHYSYKNERNVNIIMLLIHKKNVGPVNLYVFSVCSSTGKETTCTSAFLQQDNKDR